MEIVGLLVKAIARRPLVMKYWAAMLTARVPTYSVEFHLLLASDFPYWSIVKKVKAFCRAPDCSSREAEYSRGFLVFWKQREIHYMGMQLLSEKILWCFELPRRSSRHRRWNLFWESESNSSRFFYCRQIFPSRTHQKWVRTRAIKKVVLYLGVSKVNKWKIRLRLSISKLQAYNTVKCLIRFPNPFLFVDEILKLQKLSLIYPLGSKGIKKWFPCNAKSRTSRQQQSWRSVFDADPPERRTK